MLKPKTKELQQFYPRDRQEWRTWLEKNHARSSGVWLVLAKKNSGKPGISYEEAVEEALSFGWIDSRANKLDQAGYLLHFSPRKPGGIWAKSNKQRVEKLIKMGLMTQAGYDVVEASQKDGSWDLLNEIDELVIPEDLARALAENHTAHKHFQSFSESLKRQILWWLKSAKRPQTREKRIAHIINSAEHNQKPV